MKIDATIVSNQHEEIKELESARKETMEKETMEANANHTKLHMQIDLFEGQIDQQDEAVAHVRKVSNILQDEQTSRAEAANRLKGTGRWGGVKEKENEARFGNDVKILQGQLWAKDLRGDHVSLEKQLGAALSRNEDLGTNSPRKKNN